MACLRSEEQRSLSEDIWRDGSLFKQLIVMCLRDIERIERNPSSSLRKMMEAYRYEARLDCASYKLWMTRNSLEELDVCTRSDDLVLRKSTSQHRESFRSIFSVHNQFGNLSMISIRGTYTHWTPDPPLDHKMKRPHRPP